MASILAGRAARRPARRILEQVRPGLSGYRSAAAGCPGAGWIEHACARNSPQRLDPGRESWLNEQAVRCQQLGLRLLLPAGRRPVSKTCRSSSACCSPLSARRPAVAPRYSGCADRPGASLAGRDRLLPAPDPDLPDSPDTAWLIRQCASVFPPEIEERLRSARARHCGRRLRIIDHPKIL